VRTKKQRLHEAADREAASRPGSRLETWLTWHLSRGLFGRIVRESVERHPFVYGDRERVRVHPTAVINNALLNAASGTITVGEWAMLAHGVQLLTGTHDIGRQGRDRQQAVPTSGRDIVIEPGAWVASGAVVLGPAVIGANAVVAAGAVVRGDVPANTVYGGVPAVELRPAPAPATPPAP
jgi:acetyltransferase-like isoleucine patch superfamily enzyme